MHVKSKLLHIFSYLTQFTIFILPESEHLAPQNLAVHRGEVVRVTQIEGAWTECTNSDGETGWVPSLYLRLVIAHSNEFAPPPAESWQASSLDDKSEDKATKHRMTSRALEQLANLDDCPFLDFTAAVRHLPSYLVSCALPRPVRLAAPLSRLYLSRLVPSAHLVHRCGSWLQGMASERLLAMHDQVGDLLQR
jgi:hypothetical protein